MSLLKNNGKLGITKSHYISQHFCGSGPSLDSANVSSLIKDLVLAHVKVFRDDF